MRAQGRYAIIKKVADGGMAEIFLARQSGVEGFARTVIVKRILPAFSADPHFRNMLIDEAHIAMTLNHKNIVPVVDLGQAAGCTFMVLELVDGWDLSTIRLRAGKCGVRIPLGLSLYIVAEVCRALAYAHGRKDEAGQPLQIVHRDVSPQNVLVSDQGEVKVADFGIAKALGKRERTETGMIKGKLEYMSPEQALGQPLDAASDVFAAGTLLYLLATNRRPFASPTDFEALVRVQRGEFDPPEKVYADLRPSVAAIINKAMRVKPGDRHASAEEMMIEVEAVLRGELGCPGQSELKRWLRELSDLDGALPVSRRPGITTGDPTSGRWLVDGDVLVMENPLGVSGFGQTAVAPGTPPARQLPSGATPPPLPAVARATPTTAGKPGWLRGSAALVGLIGLVWLAAGRYLSPDRQRQLTGAARPAAREKLNTTARGATTPDPPGPTARAGRSGDRAARRPPADRIMLTLQTRPPGASVVGPDGSLGTTPLPLPVRAGTTHTLTFAKTGFDPATRRIRVDDKNTTVLIELRRKGAAAGRSPPRK
jgi:serine/threonine protein kinase